MLELHAFTSPGTWGLLRKEGKGETACLGQQGVIAPHVHGAGKKRIKETFLNSSLCHTSHKSLLVVV